MSSPSVMKRSGKTSVGLMFSESGTSAGSKKAAGKRWYRETPHVKGKLECKVCRSRQLYRNKRVRGYKRSKGHNVQTYAKISCGTNVSSYLKVLVFKVQADGSCVFPPKSTCNQLTPSFRYVTIARSFWKYFMVEAKRTPKPLGYSLSSMNKKCIYIYTYMSFNL